MTGTTFAAQRTRRYKGLLGLPFSNRLIYHRPFNSFQSRAGNHLIRLPSDERMHGCGGDGESNQQNLVMRLARRVMPRPSKKPWWICAGPRLRTAKQCMVDGMRSLAQRPEASGTLRSNHCRSSCDLIAASSLIRTRIIGKTGRRTLFRLAHRADGRRP